MGSRIHHFGRVVGKIEAYLQTSPWELHGEIVTDPLQGARLCMVKLPGDAGAPIVELIEPVDASSPTYRAQQNAPGWHHVCLEFETVASAEEFVRSKQMLPVTGWKPAVLFGNRAVRFVYSRSRELIELIGHEIIS